MLLPELRKVVTFDEDIHAEGHRPANPVLRMIGVAAVGKNPWAGDCYVEDLSPEIQRMAPVLGELLTQRLISLAGSGDAIEAYGKACIDYSNRSMIDADLEIYDGACHPTASANQRG